MQESIRRITIDFAATGSVFGRKSASLMTAIAFLNSGRLKNWRRKSSINSKEEKSAESVGKRRWSGSKESSSWKCKEKQRIDNSSESIATTHNTP